MIGIYKDIAKILHENNNVVICHKCKSKQTLTKDMIAECLQHGWPICCSETMTFTANQEHPDEK